ncbi:reverse transcriptase family protein [Planctomicrobium sp. SH661]|uniref:reverse transcriptase family protein n=1 Tax=Planctomicrobium sp. SH661 TaxID=3448124 RepID=UPI003F5C24C4
MQEFYQSLADVILNGSLEPLEMATRLHASLLRSGDAPQSPSPRDWIQLVVASVSAEFGSCMLPPRKQVLCHFLRSLPRSAVCEYYKIDVSRCSGPKFEVWSEEFRGWGLPALHSAGQLAAWLQVSPAQLDWLCGRFQARSAHSKWQRYSIRSEVQRSGRRRILEVPCPALRNLQRKLLDGILNRVPIHPCSHGFRKGRSTLSGVAPHAGQCVAWTLDLASFFMSIPRFRVTGVFRLLGYPESLADVLAMLTTNAIPTPVIDTIQRTLSRDRQLELQRLGRAWHLPQGAPTSPALANLVAYGLDCRLNGLAKKFEGQYSRYADDLLFSGGEYFRKHLQAFRIHAMAIILNEGFFIRPSKSRIMRRSRRQHSLGIVFNEKLNVERRQYKTLHAILHNCIKAGPQSQNHEGHVDFRSHLAGRIGYVRQLNQQKAERLQAMLEQIDWS